jgi:hypothetical protein
MPVSPGAGILHDAADELGNELPRASCIGCTWQASCIGRTW